MHELSKIISYFRSCYQVDFKAISVLNFFGKNVKDQLIVESSEFLTGNLMQFPVDSVWGREMENTLSYDSTEKALYACAFFLSGKMNVIGKVQKVFAPLFIYPVELLLENEVYYLVLDQDNVVVNPVFVEFIKSRLQEGKFNYDDFAKHLPKGYLKFDEIHELEITLQGLVPELDVTSLDNYPDLLSEEELKTVYKKQRKNSRLSLLSGVGVGLVNKPSGARGILNELEQMAKTKAHSPVLTDLFFGESKKKKTKSEKRNILTPVSLSPNQMRIFSAYDEHQLNLVIGPPGTGKSFTIAALAVDLISRGQSVLIASRNDQAGNVIADKIEKEFGLKGVVLRTAKRAFKNTLERRLKNIIYGLEAVPVLLTIVEKLQTEITKLQTEISELEKTIEKREVDELKWGKFYQKYRGGIFQNLKKDWYNYRVAQQQSIWYLMDRLDKLSVQLNNKIKRYIRKSFDYHLYKTLSKERDTVQNLLSALQAGTGNLMQQYFDQINFHAILHALPAWIVNAAEVHQHLPLEKELFDVVIIDEATQCDIASSLPLLHRGAKAIIVGDPKQLRHISFLSQNQQALFAERYQIKNLPKEKLDYRNNSVLDLASLSIGSQDQIHFLDEHYRSMPDIIQFSNDQFYAKKLKVMTATPQNLEEQFVFEHKIVGQRNAKGFNEEEADALIEKLKGIIEEEKDLHKKLCQSIGVVSPFRAQVTHLKSKIRKAIGLRDVKRHELLIGTPYHFQGEERDVIFISFAVDNDTHPSTFLYLNKADVFNVSITRARSLQHLFVSFDWKALNRNYLIAQYLQQVAEPISAQSISSYEVHDEFLEEVFKVLKRWRVTQIYKSYPVAGMIVDIVVIHNETTYCIDLVGYPGEYGNIFPIDRWRQLKRVGVKTFSLPYSSWYIDQRKSKTALKKFLNKG